MSRMRNVLEYLEQSAERFPEKSAVTDGICTYTYKELLAYSRKIGSGIAAYCRSEQPVAVLAEKGADTLAAFLGIIQAGCFYVLMNPELPIGRLEQVQQVLQAAYIVTDREHREMALQIVPEHRILWMEELMETDENQTLLSERRKRAIDTAPLYANFTSGSTGQPKGVVVSHRSVLDFIDIFTELFGITSEDRIANQAPFDFDVSVKDIYSSLKTGATLVIVPKQLFSQPAPLLDYLCDHEVTVMIWAVSALCLISIFHGLDYKVPAKVRKVLFSGEVMPPKHLKAWMDHLPEADFINLYGPTEITCNCTYHRIDRNRDYSEGVPVGKAFPNEHVFLLDEQDHEITEPDKAGEICVRGTALALGYYRMPEQTAEHFVQNPLNHCYPELIYRTGDLGRYNEYGEILFGGRKDYQIKYMGHRIELEEIERAMEDIEGIAETAQKVVDLYYSLPKRGKGKGVQVTISCACFVPKPHTPFEFVPMDTAETLQAKQKHLLESVRSRKIKVNYHDSTTSFLEGVFAKGDRRLAPVIVEAYKRGCYFDGWEECFKYDTWLQTFADLGIDPAFYCQRPIGLDEVTPWSHMDYGVTHEYLVREYQKALAAQTTQPCNRACHGCGANHLLGGPCFDYSQNLV